MDRKSPPFLGVVLLLAALCSAGSPKPTPTATPKPLSLFKKPEPLGLQPPKVLPFFGSELQVLDRPLTVDPEEQREFIREICGKERPKKQTEEERILGVLGSLAGYTCAGIAAAQWLDNLGPKKGKPSSKGADTKDPKAKTF